MLEISNGFLNKATFPENHSSIPLTFPDVHPWNKKSEGTVLALLWVHFNSDSSLLTPSSTLEWFAST
ncbi:MAG: hypothetical protein WCF01_02925, partial [Nitrososphaeraceae archaeon]